MAFRSIDASCLKLAAQFWEREALQEGPRNIPRFERQAKDDAETKDELLRELGGSGGSSGEMWDLPVQESTGAQATLDLVRAIRILLPLPHPNCIHNVECIFT